MSFEIGSLNEREARESGLRLKTCPSLERQRNSFKLASALEAPRARLLGLVFVLIRQPEGAMSETRKLAAILVADVVGYSRLGGADEDRILARLRALRSDLIDAAIAAHHGRIVKPPATAA
jgi:class 3 adenylate cyclase